MIRGKNIDHNMYCINFAEVVIGSLFRQFMILYQNGETIASIFAILNFNNKFMFVKRRCI